MKRLILFDIDGTMLAGGPAKAAFETAMLDTYGTVGDIANVSFGGKTDPQIARELLTRVGFDDRAVDEGLPALWQRYLANLEAGLGERPMRVLAGVRELLDALVAIDGVGVGLVTGNIVQGARLKLGSAGLWERFAIGSYGSDSEERDHLPAIALERARKHWRAEFASEQAVIVGDTPRDVRCARAGGTRVLAVATGRFTFSELVDAGADHVVEDLAATDRVVELLTA